MRWSSRADGAAISVDKTTGKLTKIAGALPVPRVEVSLEEGRLVRVPDWRRGGVERRSAGDVELKTAAGGDDRDPRVGAGCTVGGHGGARRGACRVLDRGRSVRKGHGAFALCRRCEDRRAQAPADREEPVRHAVDRRESARVRGRRRRDPGVGRDHRARGECASRSAAAWASTSSRCPPRRCASRPRRRWRDRARPRNRCLRKKEALVP